MPRLITAAQAAARLAVHPKTFARYVHHGRITPTIAGRKGRGGAAMFSRQRIDQLRAEREEARRYVKPEPEPPGKVDIPVSPQLEQRINAALQHEHIGKWLEDVGDEWLARAAKADPAKVEGSKQRNPHGREEDFNDHRRNHDPKNLDDPNVQHYEYMEATYTQQRDHEEQMYGESEDSDRDDKGGQADTVRRRW